MHLIFLSDKEQIGAKRRKKIPHFSDYLVAEAEVAPLGMGGAGGGGFGGFGAMGLLGSTFSFVPFGANPGTSQSSNQGGGGTISTGTVTCCWTDTPSGS
ncbi:hypothetical protein OS493_040442 [Desmophyllum pertusum]|uniref:Uncharacterized protein n=1 Tax=Desmophyllum pertusum TaxID=174260 RepID=A0A9X0CZE5_9CNID|nr:hypothetical protein OS493_040442 [Desmophyllum pertusum]